MNDAVRGSGKEATSWLQRARDAGLLKFLAFVVLLGIVFLVAHVTPLKHYLDRRVLAAWFAEVAGSPWAPVVFVLSYGLALGLGVPASLFTLSGGVVFGVWPGALYNWLGTVVGAGMAFLIARYLGRDFVQRLLRGRLVDLDEAVAARGFWAIFVMRLIPIIPFNLSNFAAGLTGIRFLPYITATGIAIAPGLTVVTWFAHALWEGTGRPNATRQIVIASAALVATMALPWVVYHLVRRRRARRPL